MAYRLARSLETLRDQINAAAPNRSKASDGWIGDASHFRTGSASDHNPWITLGGVGIVTAFDITHDPRNGCDVMAIANAIVASRDRRLKYLIYTGGSGGNPGILSSTVSPWKWRTRASDDHPHHLHISVDSDAADFDSRAAWALPGAITPPPPTKTEEQTMADLTLTNPMTKEAATAANGLSNTWRLAWTNNLLLRQLLAKQGIVADVDESQIAREVAASLTVPLKAALVAAVAKGGSAEAIADAVVAQMATQLAGA